MRNRMNPMNNKPNLLTKRNSIFEKQSQNLSDILSEKLEKIFKLGPSNMGYKEDIESLLNEIGLSKQLHLKLAINGLSKTVKNNQEIKIIASYLFFMQDFLKLVKAKGASEKEQMLLKDLLTLSDAMIYERQPKDNVLIRYGDKGNTAYIILNGQVDVLIETSTIKNLGEKTYLYYLANLIKYQEYGLLNITINENFKKFPLIIIDDITIKDNDNNINSNFQNKNMGINETINNNFNNQINENNENINKNNYQNKNKNYIVNRINNVDISNSIKNERSSKRHKSSKRKRIESDDNEIESSGRKNESKKDFQRGVFKLNFMKEEYKDSESIKRFTAKELLDMFGLKLLDKKLNKELNHCNTDEFIQRLDIFSILEKKQQDIIQRRKEKENNKKENEEKINEMNDIINVDIINQIIDEGNKDENEIKEIKDININDNNKTNSLDIKKVTNKNKEKKNKDKNNSKKIENKENIIKNNSDNDSESKENELKNNENEIKESSSSSSSSNIFEMYKNVIMGLKIFSYIKVATLGNGCLFGEMALTDANSLRKATIITTSDCDFSVLNKKTFNNCIRLGAQKHLKEILQFFIELPIFRGIPEGVFYHKYYTNFTKVTVLKGKNIINQGEIPHNITLLQSGQYGVTTQMSLYDLTRLIFHYSKYFNNNTDIINDMKNKKNKKENKSNITRMNDIKNQNKLLIQNIVKIKNEENFLLNDNIKFKKFYFSHQNIRISEISCPDVIINEEYIDENGLFAFSIEAKSPENVIYTLNNKFYYDLQKKNISVKINQDYLLSKKMNLMIQRLLIIRNSMISTFFDSKSKKEIGETVIRELNDAISLNLKKKRSVIKKGEKIIKTNENENKENKDIIHLNSNSYNSNSHSHRNKKIDLKKNCKDITGSSIEDKKKNYNSENKSMYKHIDNILIKINSINNINNSKDDMNTLKSIRNKKTDLSSYRDRVSITIRDLKLNNQLPFKDNDEEILFSLYNKNDTYTNEKNNLTKYYNNLNYFNYNRNISRNQKNHFRKKNLIKNKFNTSRKQPLSSYDTSKNDIKNNIIFNTTRKVLMNNLIWENIKSAIKMPIKKKQKINIMNYNKTANNFYKLNNSNKKYNNNNLEIYLESNFKSDTNRELYNKRISFNVNNKSFIKSFNNNEEKNDNESKDISLNSKTENINNINALSSPSLLKKFSQLSKIKPNKDKTRNYQNKMIQKSTEPLSKLKKNKITYSNLPNITFKLKKYYTPQEINFMRMNRKKRFVMDGNKYYKIRIEKFETNRKDYYNKNLKNRMNFFYGYNSDEKQ